MAELKLSDGTSVQVANGTPMKDVANKNDIGMVISCGDGTCGTCIFRVTEGAQNLSAMESTEQSFLKDMGASSDSRLGCQCVVNGNCAIEVGGKKSSSSRSSSKASPAPTVAAAPLAAKAPVAQPVSAPAKLAVLPAATTKPAAPVAAVKLKANRPVDSVVTDVAIIGAGPVGLFGAFYSGLRGMSVKLIDSQPMLGGRVSASYPEKYIYDVAGFPKVTGQELIDRLVEQAKTFGPTIHLEENILCVSPNPTGGFRIDTDKRVHFSKTVIVATGMGACFPKKHGSKGAERFEGKSVLYAVGQKEMFRDKRVIIAGGGDSAIDWANDLSEIARSVTLVHRRGDFRAHERSIERLKATKTKICTFAEIVDFRGKDVLQEAIVRNCITGAARFVPVDYALIMYGFSSSTQSFDSWGIKTENNHVLVNGKMETNVPGIFAAGDIAAYESKLKLIVTGFGEITTAANNAKVFINPEEKAQPHHSTSLAEAGHFGTEKKAA